MDNTDLTRIKVNKIDADVYGLLKTETVEIHSVFHHSMNVLVKETLITIGSNISMNKHHVVTDRVSFMDNGVNLLSTPKPVENGFGVDKLLFFLADEALVKCEKYESTKVLTHEHCLKAKALLHWIAEQKNINILNYDKTDTILNYQFNRIFKFLELDNYDSAVEILGLGVGLTPLGDDVLLGYMLAKKSMSKNICWLSGILELAKERTNLISYQSYKDIFDGFFTEQFTEMINEYFERDTFNYAKTVIDYGATSGAGILVGFIFGLLPQGGIRSECLENIREYLL